MRSGSRWWRSAEKPLLTAAEIEAIANALGHTELGLTGREKGHLIGACRMVDPGPITKARRRYNAFAERQNTKQDRTHILEFICMAMAPVRYAREPGRYEPMRANLNQTLAFAGLVVDDAGNLTSAARATTLRKRSGGRCICVATSKSAKFILTCWRSVARSCCPTTSSTQSRRR